jgi:hypothetical protein
VRVAEVRATARESLARAAFRFIELIEIPEYLRQVVQPPQSIGLLDLGAAASSRHRVAEEGLGFGKLFHLHQEIAESIRGPECQR